MNFLNWVNSLSSGKMFFACESATAKNIKNQLPEKEWYVRHAAAWWSPASDLHGSPLHLVGMDDLHATILASSWGRLRGRPTENQKMETFGSQLIFPGETVGVSIQQRPSVSYSTHGRRRGRSEDNMLAKSKRLPKCWNQSHIKPSGIR